MTVFASFAGSCASLDFPVSLGAGFVNEMNEGLWCRLGVTGRGEECGLYNCIWFMPYGYSGLAQFNGWFKVMCFKPRLAWRIDILTVQALWWNKYLEKR